MKVKVTKSKEIEVELTDEQCENIISDYIKKHLDYADIHSLVIKQSLESVYTYFSGKKYAE